MQVDARALGLDDVLPLETAVAQALNAALKAGGRLVTDAIMAAALERLPPPGP